MSRSPSTLAPLTSDESMVKLIVAAPCGAWTVCMMSSTKMPGSATERRNIEVRIDPLKACHDHDLAGLEQATHAIEFGDLANPGAAVDLIGAQADLAASEADGVMAGVMNRHRRQRDGDLLAGREE